MSIKKNLREFMFRVIASRRLTRWVDLDIRRNKRIELEKQRIKEKRPHEVTYFHSVSDPYSYLVLQKLDDFVNHYDINFNFVLVGEPPLQATPEPEIYKKYSLIDAKRIAPFYSTIAPTLDGLPSQQDVENIERVLLNTSNKNLLKKSIELGHQLWQGEGSPFEELAKKEGLDPDTSKKKINEGNVLRKKFKHYLAAVFNYEEENYWGLDRLLHLEKRLSELGLNNSDNNFISTRTVTTPENIKHNDELSLEFYPSLNSPYTYISFERAKNLSKTYGLTLIVKPVLPMLMRGMKIPGAKGAYILTDASREGEEAGIKFKKVLTPIGKPAERAYSLFPWIDSKNKGFEYLHQLMIASFHDGINIYKESYLKGLINKLGLDWNEAKTHLDNTDWKTLLENNRLDMYKNSLWGVPCFTLRGPNNFTFSVWGQDRFWLLEKEIIKITK